jgi:hypothetical protein
MTGMVPPVKNPLDAGKPVGLDRQLLKCSSRMQARGASDSLKVEYPHGGENYLRISRRKLRFLENALQNALHFQPTIASCLLWSNAGPCCLNQSGKKSASWQRENIR